MVKKAIEFILDDPLAGKMWDGQFLEQLAQEPIDRLRLYEKKLKKIPSYIDDNIDDSMWEFDFEKEDFMKIFNKFKKVISKL